MYYRQKRLGLILLAFLLAPTVLEGGLFASAMENQFAKQAVKQANKDPVKAQAQSAVQNHQEEQMIADHRRLRKQADQEFKNRVKGQLKAKGLPVPKSERALANSPVTLMVEFDRPPAALQEEKTLVAGLQRQQDPVARRVRRNARENNIKEVRAAGQQVVAEQRSARDAVEKIAKKKAQHEFGYLTNTMSIVTRVKDVKDVQAVAGVKRVTPANIYQPQDLAADQIVQASTTWHHHHLRGDKTVIAIVDTGIDTKHELMSLGKEAKQKISQTEAKQAIERLGHGCYSSAKVPYSYNYADGTVNTVFDLNKNSMHGMHVAGLAAGYSALPNFAHFDQNHYAIGTAPNAQLLNMKVFSNTGGGASSDDIIAAIEDAVFLKADVINLSLGSASGNVDQDSPEQRAINLAAQQGSIPVVAAGNAGLSTSNTGLNVINTRQTNDTGTLSSPGVLDSALTVASSNNLAYDIPTDGPAKLSHLSSFSSYGPTPDLQLKPDITAPGGRLLSSLNDNRYDYMSGTSMATPVMAGSAALFAQSLAGRVPAPKISQHIKTALMNTARPLVDEKTSAIISPRVQGAGLARVDDAIDSRIKLTTSKGTSSLSLGAFSESKQTLQVFLENQSDYEQNFRYQTDHRVWTDGSVPGKMATDKQILGADLSLIGTDAAKQVSNSEQKIIRVPAHQRVAVLFGLTLPDQAKGGFVEGYLQFKPVDSAGHKLKEGAQLAMPYLGYYGDWQNQQIFDRPAWDPDSYFGQSALVDSERVPLGLNKAGKIIPENIAITPDLAMMNGYSQPLLNLWRNAHHVVAEIYQHNPAEDRWAGQQPLRRVSVDDEVLKSYYQRGRDQFTTYDASGHGWSGDRWNGKTGRNEPVADGQYYYQLSAEAASGRLNGSAGGRPTRQRLIFPIKVDRHGPVVTNPHFQVKKQLNPSAAQSKKSICLAAGLTDDLSGIDTFGRIGFVVNGLLTIVDQPLQENHQLHQQLLLPMSPDQLQAFHTNQKNRIQILAFDNAGNLTKQSFTLSGPNADFLVDQPASTLPSPVNGIKQSQPGMIKNTLSPVSQGRTGIGQGEPAKDWLLVNANQPMITFDHFINLFVNTVTAQTRYYNQQTQKLTISGHLRQAVDQLLIGESQGKRLAVAVDPQTLAFQTVVEAKPNAKTVVPIQLIVGGQTLVDGGLRFYVDTSLPELNLMNERTLERLNDGTYQVKTNQKAYQLKGQAGDNYDGYQLMINGDMIAKKNFSLTFNQKTTGGITEFSVPFHLTEGDNRAVLVIRDAVGNRTEKKVNVRYYQSTLPAPTIAKAGFSVNQLFPMLLTAKANQPANSPSDNNLTIVYSLNQGQQWQTYQGDVSIRENKAVQFKTIDAYGNESKVVTVIVNEFPPTPNRQKAVVNHRPSWPRLGNQVSRPLPRHDDQAHSQQRQHGSWRDWFHFQPVGCWWSWKTHLLSPLIDSWHALINKFF